MLHRQKITGPCAWTGPEIRESARWIVELSPADLAEIEAALAHVDRLDIPWHAITQEDFPLQGLKARLAAAREELEEGSGMVKLRTIPVERYSEAQLKRLYYGLGTHLGHLLFQNNRGELMREIRDEGAEIGQRYGEVKTEQGGTFLSSYARTLSNGALRFHTDRCDVVGLLCVRQAGRGGVSKLASSVAIHNTILERRPDLLDVLFQPYFRSRFGEEKGMEKTAYPLPIFGLQDGKFTSHYSLTYIEAAEFIPGIPPLSPAQREALTLLQQVAEELSFEMVLEPGDIQLLNNHVIYHGRTPFQDDAPSGRSRLLYRLWLAMPNSRRLPDDHAILWRDVTPGSLRGGIGQAVVPA